MTPQCVPLASIEHSSLDWDSVLPYWGKFIYDRFDIVMKIEYWIGLADILLRIADIHVGPLNTVARRGNV